MEQETVALGLKKDRCSECNDLMIDGYVVARIASRRYPEKYVALCDDCFWKWYVDTFVKKLKGKPQVLKEIVNRCGYVIKLRNS